MEQQLKKGFGKGWVLILYAFLAYFTATSVCLILEMFWSIWFRKMR